MNPESWNLVIVSLSRYVRSFVSISLLVDSRPETSRQSYKDEILEVGFFRMSGQRLQRRASFLLQANWTHQKIELRKERPGWTYGSNHRDRSWGSHPVSTTCSVNIPRFVDIFSGLQTTLVFNALWFRCLKTATSFRYYSVQPTRIFLAEN